MAKQVLGLVSTFGFDAPVAQNVIAVASTVNAGNAAQAGNKAIGILGATLEPTDTNGYASVQIEGVTQVTVGANPITAGQYVAPDANGLAQGVTPLAAGGALTGMLGVAISSSASGGLVDVLVNPGVGLS